MYNYSNITKKITLKKSVYEANYDRLIKIFGKDVFENPELCLGERYGITIENGMYMKLSLSFMYYDEKKQWNVFYLAHTSIQNGDVMEDPGMHIAVKVGEMIGYVEATSFTNHYMGTYQEVYLEDGRYYPRIKKELNSFLITWLKNLKLQRFDERLEEFRAQSKERMEALKNKQNAASEESSENQNPILTT